MNFDVFKKSIDDMVKKNNDIYTTAFGNQYSLCSKRTYTEDEVKSIIESGSLAAQQKLSRTFFNTNGFYKQIVLYYATLLKYCGVLIPNLLDSKASYEDRTVKQSYAAASNFVSLSNLPNFLTNCAIKSLVDGAYYGIIKNADKNGFSVIDLPAEYCASNFCSANGQELIEFNVAYFNNFNNNEELKKRILSGFPKEISSYYDKYYKGKVKTAWMLIPEDIGVCFTFVNNGRPFFLSTIPTILQYDDTIEVEMNRALEEIRKIIVQKIPHNSEGTFLLEPDEVTELHSGAVGMMSKNKNTSVLTTYADVDAIVSKTSNDSVNSNVTTMAQNIYNTSGVSSLLFGSTGSTTLDSSVKKDISLMMYLANSFSLFLTNLINSLFSNKKVNYNYKILPVGVWNEEKYIDSYLKMANSGYSFIMPAIASGLSQRDLLNIKDLENKGLKLLEKLIPLSTSYTQSGTTGAPTKEQEEKAETTIETEISRSN